MSLKRIKEVNWDTVAKKLVLRDDRGAKTDVVVGGDYVHAEGDYQLTKQLAPGGAIASTDFHNAEATFEGTSFSFEQETLVVEHGSVVVGSILLDVINEANADRHLQFEVRALDNSVAQGTNIFSLPADYLYVPPELLVTAGQGRFYTIPVNFRIGNRRRLVVTLASLDESGPNLGIDALGLKLIRVA